ncbi:hypothetical protein EVAR_19005_1 [Eumeta japonica]|uniref:MADF domain-containing protein n=1 Tax=Eumeta variegata TaxID=151549 RepID=A0A4C1V9K0_EUMVA|nr:hypothetical protein EVAR_19005_1 [Eumeta japonica]
MAIDTERLIAEVQSRPVLWDPRTTAYKNRDVKQNAWVEVARATFEKFDNLSQDGKEKAAEELGTYRSSSSRQLENIAMDTTHPCRTTENVRHDRVKSVLQRWKSARDQYVRLKANILKEGLAAKSKIKYIFANEMSFLDPVTNLQRIPQTLHLTDNRITDNNATKTEKIQMATQKSPLSREPEATPFKRKKRNVEEMTRFEKELLNVLHKSNSESASDEDVAFFNSLLPTVRLLDRQQKFQFRSQVLQILTPYTSNFQRPPSLLHKALTSLNQHAQSVLDPNLLEIPVEFQCALNLPQNKKHETSQTDWLRNSVRFSASITSDDTTNSSDENCLRGNTQQFKIEKEEEEENGSSEVEEHFEFDFKKL